MLYLILPLLVTVVLLIRAEIHGVKARIYILKPISTLLVIAVALLPLVNPDSNPVYSVGILIGLALCFGGDLALMFQDRRGPFMFGLVLFLLGHIAYTVTFSILGMVSGWTVLSTVLLLATGLAFYRLIAPNLASMRIPVILYFLVISLMLIQATGMLASPHTSDSQAALIIVGAGLFYISDVMLAANRFWRPWKYNRISLAFYYSGQLLIALAATGFD